MEQSALAEDSLIQILLEPKARAELVRTMREETGFHLPITNHYEDLAPRCKATPEQLEEVVYAFLRDEHEDDRLIHSLVFHPRMPEKVLFDLYKQGRCIESLGHRTKPRRLLEKLAEEKKYSEAITTLAIYYYGAEDESDEAFAKFVAKHKDDPMLIWNLERSKEISERKRAIGLSVLKS